LTPSNSVGLFPPPAKSIFDQQMGSREDFLKSLKAAFPSVDWDKAYAEFRAAGESDAKQQVLSLNE